MTTFSPSQQAVLDNFPEFLMDESKELTISGFAGSGKSFLVEYLAKVAVEKQQQMTKLIAPEVPIRHMHFSATTNKAAAVLETMLNREVNTIHSLLGLTVQNNYKTGKVTLIKKTPGKNLRNSIIYIDEASMINADLLQIIREHTHKVHGCKVIFIGDSYQLPPVMEDMCPVFDEGDNTFFLTEIQRQVEGSPIIQLSAQYRDILDDHELDWPIIENVDDTIMHYDDKNAFFEAIKNAYSKPHEPDDYKVVAWANTRVRDYNTWIRGFKGHNGPYEANETVVTNKPLFERKNRVAASTDSMHIIASVHEHTIENIPGHLIELHGIAGSFFQPNNWAQADKLANKYRKEKDWPAFFKIREEWADLRPVHASTVHKAQGSTYNEVFIDLSNIGKNNKWREVARLVYVAITRARYKVHIFGELKSTYNKKPPINLMEAFKNVECL